MLKAAANILDGTKMKVGLVTILGLLMILRPASQMRINAKALGLFGGEAVKDGKSQLFGDTQIEDTVLSKVLVPIVFMLGQRDF